MDDYKPNERIVDRAVSLWRRLLENPKFDNGDPSFAGMMGSAMASMIPNNATPDRLDSFCGHLRRWLLTPDERGHFWNKQSLSVDYHPDEGLAVSATAAGLSMRFPWKTRMWLSGDHLSVRAGYSAPEKFHYPLSDDRWLVTTLSGSDIALVIDYINGGKPQFTIE